MKTEGFDQDDDADAAELEMRMGGPGRCSILHQYATGPLKRLVQSGLKHFSYDFIQEGWDSWFKKAIKRKCHGPKLC